MKILAIRIKNLASIEGEFEIDFKKEPLQSAGIFAITGPTGSGKSTILDAICLALFAKTPRISDAKENGIDLLDASNNKIKQGDNRNILRKGTSEAYAEVDFIGIDKQAYRSCWSVRRAGNKINGNLQNDTIELTSLQSQTRFAEKKTETLKEIERLLGLNYDQFTRSVLLAQGDFTAFLKAEKDEKSSLLEKLTGTEIYSDISKKIYENYKISENELKELNIKIEGIKLLPETELIDILAKKDNLTTIISDTEALIKKNTDIIKWYDDLSEIEKEIEEAEILLNKAEKEKDSNKNRYNTLKFIEAIQGFKSVYETKKATESNLITKVNEKTEIYEKINILKEIIKELSEKHSQLEILSQQAKNEKTKADPVIKEAKELDILISEKNHQIDLLKNEIINDITEKLNIEAKINDYNKLINALKAEFQEKKNWERENQNRRQIAEQINLISSKLKDLRKDFSNKNQLITETDNYKKKSQKLNDNIIEYQSIINENEINLLKLQKEYKTLILKCNNIDINLVSDSINKLNENNEKIIKGIAIWEQYINNQKEYNSINLKVEEDNNAIKDYQNKLDLLNNSILQIKSKKEQTQNILSKAEIATTASVENLRQHLSDNEECPVCGSTHHPYRKEKSNLKNLITDIKNELNDLNIQYDNLLKEIAGIESLMIKIKADIDENTKAINKKSALIKELYNSWLEFDFKTGDKNENILNNLNIELINNKNELLSLQQELTNYNNAINKSNEIKLKIDLLEKSKNNAQNELNICKTDIHNLNSNITNNKNVITNIDNNISEICNLLSLYFTNKDWFAEWEKNHNLFEEKLLKWTEEWFSNIKKSEELNSALKETETENQIEHEKLKSISNSLEIKQINQINLNNIISELKNKRNEIFEGKDINIIENQINNEIEILNKQIIDNQKNYTDKNNELIRLSTIFEEVNKIISELNTKLSSLQNEIDEWINSYNSNNNQNINIGEIEKNLHYNQYWIDTENNFFKLLNEEIIRLKSKQEDKQKRHIVHKMCMISDITKEFAFEELNSANILLEVNKHNLNEIDFIIKTNENNQKIINKFKAEIDVKTENYENWYRINELIGSADGKKFRQIAQEYTLDILLNNANKQLKLLSSRYFLNRIENTLALQVIDRDMGNETRSVYSLSGGESFIVSLALALGLASLSSNKMQVESLFIDEGFGSLDPATLSIAMDALEQLYNQGRKVGVISHIQEMTERIPTQIKLIKQSNGKSKIEITGN